MALNCNGPVIGLPQPHGSSVFPHYCNCAPSQCSESVGSTPFECWLQILSWNSRNAHCCSGVSSGLFPFPRVEEVREVIIAVAMVDSLSLASWSSTTKAEPLLISVIRPGCGNCMVGLSQGALPGDEQGGQEICVGDKLASPP